MKLFIAGDLCPQARILSKISKGEFDILDRDIKRVINEADYSIVNFECPIIKGYEKPIQKSGPNLSCPVESLALIKEMGFKAVTLANNHFRDYGQEGVVNTLETFKKAGVEIVGGGVTEGDARKMLCIRKEGKVVTIINACENEFSIATRDNGGANPLDIINLYEDINNAKQNSDLIVVILHGGVEHYQLPTPRMKRLYCHIIDLGADVIVNHHQHCYSGYEIYKGKPIFYGIGNFCFDRDKARNSIWNYGFAVVIKYEKDVTFEIHPYEQCNMEASIKGIPYDKFIHDIMCLNSIIEDNSRLEDAFDNFILSKKMNFLTKIIPFENRWIKALFRRNYLGTWFSEKKLVELKNITTCESHLETYQLLFKLLTK